MRYIGAAINGVVTTLTAGMFIWFVLRNYVSETPYSVRNGAIYFVAITLSLTIGFASYAKSVRRY